MAEKILVVDDSKLVTDIVRMRLSMYGYERIVGIAGRPLLGGVVRLGDRSKPAVTFVAVQRGVRILIGVAGNVA